MSVYVQITKPEPCLPAFVDEDEITCFEALEILKTCPLLPTKVSNEKAIEEFIIQSVNYFSMVQSVSLSDKVFDVFTNGYAAYIGGDRNASCALFCDKSGNGGIQVKDVDIVIYMFFQDLIETSGVRVSEQPSINSYEISHEGLLPFSDISTIADLVSAYTIVLKRIGYLG